MRKILWLCFAVAVGVAAIALYPQGRNSKETEMPAAVAFRVLLGVGDQQPTAWDGSVSVAPGRVVGIQGWRTRLEDAAESSSSWKISSGASLGQVGRAFAGQAPPIVENGVIIAASSDDPSVRFSITTKQGEFAFQAAEVPAGVKKRFLNGRAVVDRVPNTLRLTDSPEDQDSPAIAQSGDSLWVSYTEFVRGDRARHRWGQMGADPPKNFDFVARPTGGDQVFLVRYYKARRTWGAPVAVTDPKQDIMRSAVAVDGKQRVWVFWSANRGGNFDIYAKSYSGGRWSKELRLTTDAGTDVNPVAATDTAGRVWLAWQGFRNTNLEVLAAAQKGDAFTPEVVVSTSKASDWDPAIAAAPNGEVAIAWDTYDKGDYDVYFRRLKMDGQIRMEAPVPVAASTRFEARPSIAYDRESRLWTAYEVSEARWGKDTGPYAQKGAGIQIYRNHNLQVKCFQGSQVFTAAADALAGLLPAAAAPGGNAAAQRKQGQKKAQMKAQPLDEHDTAPRPGAQTLNSFPRLATGPDGLVYLAFRMRVLPGRSSAGTVWIEQLLYFDGATWKGPLTIPNTDQWIENRPAMAAIAPGDLMLVAVSDHRLTETLRARRVAQNDLALPDAVNADLYAAELLTKGNVQSAKLDAIPPETVAAPDAGASPERDQIAQMRNYRVALGGQQARLLRGEFHRHTDVSYDGTGDGPLIDAYRYLIDAASMDWGGCCDHDNGVGEYPWWYQQKLTDAYKLGDKYVSMFSYERSVSYPEGHRNTVFAQRGVRPLPRLPKVADTAPGHAPDTLLLYDYLRKYDGIVASHTSGTDMGTDWRDNDSKLEPIVEIYQGCRQNYEMPGAPRTNTEENSIGGWRPLGFVSLALQKGYRLGFQASSDHGSTHISYCNLWVTKPTRAGVLEAFKLRRVYGATDNILADVRCGSHFMGEEFDSAEPPSIAVKLRGTAEFAKVHIIKDGQYVYSVEPRRRDVEFTWRDGAAVKGKTSYYYIRGEQSDGELVWVSPMWITYK